MRSLFLLIFSCVSYIVCTGQKQTVVIMHYYKTNYYRDSFIIDIAKPITLGSKYDLYPAKLLSFSKVNEKCTSISSYSIADTTLGIICEGFGHETVLIPGDTIEFELDTVKSKPILGKYPTGWIQLLHFKGSNATIYSLMDSIVYVAGDLSFSKLSYRKAVNIDSFYLYATQVFDNRMSFLNSYCERNKLPYLINKLVAEEIKSAYFRDLVSPCGMPGYPKTQFPDYYLKKLLEFTFDHDLLLKTRLSLHQLHSKLIMSYIKDSINEVYTNAGLLTVFSQIKRSRLSNAKAKDLLLLSHLSSIAPAPYSLPSFDSLALSLSHVTSFTTYLAEIIETRSKANNLLGNKLNIEDALSTILQLTDGTSKTVQSLFTGKPILIDVWASWCKPCLEKMPLISQLEKKYKDKVGFYFLSFDKNTTEWKKKTGVLGVNGEHLLVLNNFQSLFAKYFNIYAIPRYLLFDKLGKYVPFDKVPSTLNDFTSVIDQLGESHK